MAFSRGVNLITNGLVLSIDAANIKSYSPSQSIAYDLCSFGNNGTLQNNPTFDIGGLGNFSLDGINQRIYIPLSGNLVRCYDCTIQFTVKLPLYSGGQRCILSYRGGSGGQLYIGKASSGIFSYYNSLSSQGVTVGNIPNNTIAICAVVIDSTGGNVSHYINGQLAGVGTGRTGFSTTYNSYLYLGYDNGGTNEYMLGNFYNYSHYNRVLTGEEITQNYNAIKTRFGL